VSEARSGIDLAKIWGRRVFPLVSVLALVVILVVVALLTGMQEANLLRALIDLLIVLALYLFSGISGIFSFGHIAFVAIGAYTAGILTIPIAKKDQLFEMPPLLESLSTGPIAAILAGALVAAVAAAIFGLAILRLSGIAASIGTFSILVIVHVVAENLKSVTNGQSGMTAVPMTIGVWALVLAAGVFIVIVFLYQSSPWGLRLRASREDDVAAQAVGIRVRGERWIAWVGSAALAGAAGAMYAQVVGTFAPGSFYLSQTFVIITMLVVGGSRSLAGAVTGVAVITVINEVLRRTSAGFTLGDLKLQSAPALTPILLAIFMLVLLIVRPSGLTKGREFTIPHRREVAGKSTRGRDVADANAGK